MVMLVVEAYSSDEIRLSLREHSFAWRAYNNPPTVRTMNQKCSPKHMPQHPTIKKQTTISYLKPSQNVLGASLARMNGSSVVINVDTNTHTHKHISTVRLHNKTPHLNCLCMRINIIQHNFSLAAQFEEVGAAFSSTFSDDVPFL